MVRHVINPIATYRLQFHQDFTLKDALQVIPYLRELGIGCVYASPIFEAVPGSTHGYDMVNPLRINPEIGTLDELRTLSACCKANRLNWIQDIVPNHMAFHPSNKWLMDVLEKGPFSEYAPVFDTCFSSDFFQDPVRVPFLGCTLEEVIANGELKLVLREGKLNLAYYDQYYPINVKGYARLLARLAGVQGKTINLLHDAVQEVSWCKQRDKAAGNQARDRFFNIWRRFLRSEKARTLVDGAVAGLNNDTEEIRQLCEEQYYELCSWESSNHRINYRRFFTVNDLICLQVQNKEVFKRMHQFIKDLIEEGVFQGIRVDHLDGLFDPEQYVNELRDLVGPNVYIVVEKILASKEHLPASWPIQGTTGYDFLAAINQLLTIGKSERKFDQLYRKLVAQPRDIQEQIWEKKRFILEQYMQGELENLVRFFKQTKGIHKQALKEIGKDQFKEAIAALLVYCPVYRFYGNQWPLSEKDKESLKKLFDVCHAQQLAAKDALDVLEKLWLAREGENKNLDSKLLYLYQRLMQFSGPLMAKGVEDTLMYTYHRFIGHNEVGDSPTSFGLSVEHFHLLMAERQQNRPLDMNATATHDTKRGEDARARLQALSGLPKAWKLVVKNLERLVVAVYEEELPEINDRYFIYQTLMASYPLEAVEEDAYIRRLDAYLAKALREAKVNSHWSNPNEAYEQRCIHFAHKLLDKGGSFWPLWLPLLERIKDYGMLNSLVQTTLKVAAPGVPDVYQGTENWDFSFVDPDNRRPVPFEKYQAALYSFSDSKDTLLDYWHKRNNGYVKQWLTQRLLRYRRQQAVLFEKGIYRPLRVRGRYRNHVLAFYRQYQQQWMICIVPLHVTIICADQHCEIEAIDWKDTRIDWPHHIPLSFFDVLNDIDIKRDVADSYFLSDLFHAKLPLAVLKAEGSSSTRAAGILMAVSSLPSAFGIGDLGPKAHHFALKLATARQRYWQLLPMNPTRKAERHSPYSSYAAFAGNALLISPEILCRKGWLTKHELNTFRVENQSHIQYDGVAEMKQTLLHRAFVRFLRKKVNSEYRAFVQFMQKEKEWLTDFALYVAIKQEQGGKPWYEWPKELKMRQKRALAVAAKRNKALMLGVMWQQYEFFEEWYALKAYCETLNIRLLGDLPIYVHYDSVDVWQNRELFKLNNDGSLLGLAGVPPDYFNSNGQLWGMPTFNWPIHANNDYAWWLARLRKNMTWYHEVRLDHFRAFYNYWEVSANEKSAIKGRWEMGPGADLFNRLEKEIDRLPFIAEDLGDISQEVYDLRDRLGLPGMRVLQFAFGNDMPHSPHIPHQYCTESVVYTGTHDNQTVVGWFKSGLDVKSKLRLTHYIGHRVCRGNVHQVMIRLAYASVAKLAVVPMQDVLGLDDENRMNIPATTENNWTWRLKPKQFKVHHLHWLSSMTHRYNR